MNRSFKIFAGAFSAAVAILGVAGVVMGIGYVVNKRTRLENETEEFHESMSRRDSKTGWASIAAGIGVAGASIPLYGLVVRIGDTLAEIRQTVLGK